MTIEKGKRKIKMSEKVNCPFCGNIVEKDAYRCSACGALFSEPELPNVKFQEFRIFLALTLLTGGLFSIFWFIVNAKPLTKLTTNKKDSIKLNIWLILLLVLFVLFYFGFSRYLVPSLILLILINLTYRTLRIIQKYTKETYGVTPEINPYYIVIFNVLYLIHFIDTYKERVLEIHEYFDLKSPYMIALIFILIFIQCTMILNPVVYDFYRWLFGTFRF